MSYMRNDVIWAEMARRKVQFHADDEWSAIRLWGLFSWGAVRRLLKTGELVTDMRRENKIVWVRPSTKAWETKIKPLVEKHSLDELTTMAGWGL